MPRAGGLADGSTAETSGADTSSSDSETSSSSGSSGGGGGGGGGGSSSRPRRRSEQVEVDVSSERQAERDSTESISDGDSIDLSTGSSTSSGGSGGSSSGSSRTRSEQVEVDVSSERQAEREATEPISDGETIDLSTGSSSSSDDDIGPVRETITSFGGGLRDRTSEAAREVDSRVIQPTVDAGSRVESAVDGVLPGDTTLRDQTTTAFGRAASTVTPSEETLDRVEPATQRIDDFGESFSGATFGRVESQASDVEAERTETAGPVVDPIDALDGLALNTSSIAAGAGDFTEGVFGAPQSAVEAGRAAPEASEAAGDIVREDGVVAGGAGLGGLALFGGGALAADAAGSAVEDPGRALGNVGLGTVTGTGVARGLERGTAGARLRIEGRDGPDIDAAATTRQQDRIERGEQPVFETPTDAPGPVAAQEFRQRSREQPAELQDAVGSDQVTLRTESQRLPGDLEAQSGGFELPGLFASADFAPLRFGQTRSQSGGFEVRTPRLFGRPERASAFETPEIRAMPESAAGSGFALRRTDTDEVVETGVPQAEAARRADQSDNLERIPDPEQPGTQFLDSAEPGTAFVRPGGDRTPEFEAIFPPGTQFQRVQTGTVEAGGTRGTLDIFRLADDQRPAGSRAGDRDVEGAVDVDAPAAQGDADLFTADEISARMSSGGTVPDTTPVTPAATPFGSTPSTETGGLFDGFGSSFDGPSRPRDSQADSTVSSTPQQPSRTSPASSTAPTTPSTSVFGAPTSTTATPSRGPPSSASPPFGGSAAGVFGSPGASSPAGSPADSGGSPGGGPPSGGPAAGSPPPDDGTPAPRFEFELGRQDADRRNIWDVEPETPGFENPVATGTEDIGRLFGF